MRFLSLALLLLLFPASLTAQTAAPPPTPQRQALQQKARDERAQRESLQSQGRQVLQAALAREAAGACTSAQTTVDFDECFDKELAITTQNLQTFRSVIRNLLMEDGANDLQPQQDAAGIAGPSLKARHILDEFNRLEAVWKQYSTTACAAAFHQMEGGTGGPSFGLECQIKLTRDHMRELDMIYGEDLHL